MYVYKYLHFLVILAYSVSQMTDIVKVSDVTTQTLIPKFTGDIFLRKYFADNGRMKRNIITLEDDAGELHDDSPKTNLLQPTLSSWNFDYGEVNNDTTVKNFIPNIIRTRRPHQNSKHLLQPFPSNIEMPEHDWNLFLLSIDVLLEETNKLLDTIEKHITARQMYNTTLLHSIGLASIVELNFPSEKWLPLIEEEEQLLAEMIKNL